MTSSTRRRAVAALLAVAAVPAAASASTPLPGDIAVEAGHKPYLTVHAEGDQVYTCNGASWGPSTPDADLYGANGQHLGTHYGGPAWEARDGSRVVAQRDSGVTVDPTAIPWLRLKAVSKTAGADGDRLAHTSYIQRINTTGGLPPAAGECTTETAGVVRAVPYTADYVFWKPTGS